ncbi:hypothetical protein N0V88_008091 [Collariella sp. IMI 366227]|nr:hypothetical protein N0V88_008091 [Collariella sp. IMI 366227]
MWLVNCSNHQLEENDVGGPDAKEYWILSHTWGEEEVTFQDMDNLELAAKKKGFQKIRFMCNVVAKEGGKFAWIDTCCINKSSSAELQESINSMFYWYQKAYRCIAYLEDLECSQGSYATENELRKCRWFTRGWTLQELLAPSDVVFYDKEWSPRGTKKQLARPVSNITRISVRILGDENPALDLVPVAQRMSWAANRQTTRMEDRVYCLFGIFDVQMPLMYGEKENAFIRLQEMIFQKTNDMSLFAWIEDTESATQDLHESYRGLLARDLSSFSTCSAIMGFRNPVMPAPSWKLSNHGIEVRTALEHSTSKEHWVTKVTGGAKNATKHHSADPFCYRLVLHCVDTDQSDWADKDGWDKEILAIWLRKTGSIYVRFKPTERCSLKPSNMVFGDPTTIHIATNLTGSEALEAWFAAPALPNYPTLRVEWNRDKCGRDIEDIRCVYHPEHLWDKQQLRYAAPINFRGEWLTIGLVEATITSRPYDRTVWVFCGLLNRRGSGFSTAWVELAAQGLDGIVPALGRRWHRSELVNPFFLASVFEELHVVVADGILGPLRTVCEVELYPEVSVEASATLSRASGPGTKLYVLTVNLSYLGPSSARAPARTSA